MERKIIAIGVLSVLLGAAVGACGAFALREVNMQRSHGATAAGYGGYRGGDGGY